MEKDSAILGLDLAYIFELYGRRDNALQIYQKLLLENADNLKAQKAIKRLMLTSNNDKNLDKKNEQFKQLFCNPKDDNDLLSFQGWLLQWN